MKATSVERALWVIGVLLIASYGVVRIDAETGRREGIESFIRVRASSSTVPSEIALASAEQSQWSVGRIRAYAASLDARPRVVPEALLRIPSVKLSVPVYADTSADSLNRGAGFAAAPSNRALRSDTRDLLPLLLRGARSAALYRSRNCDRPLRRK